MPTSRQITDFNQSVVWPNMGVKDSIVDDAVTWVGANLQPEDIFSETQLEKWAEANGYVKATDNE